MTATGYENIIPQSFVLCQLFFDSSTGVTGLNPKPKGLGLLDNALHAGIIRSPLAVRKGYILLEFLPRIERYDGL